MKITALCLVVFFQWFLILAEAKQQKSGSKIEKEEESIGPIKNVSIPVGRDATMACTITGKFSMESLRISWIKVRTQTILTMDARVITRNPRISVVEREGDLWQLTIKDLKPSDQGWYMCQINTDPMVSERGFLEVTEPPSFRDEKCTGDLIVKLGQSAVFVCEANGNPRPSIGWKREDDRPLSGAKAEGSTLTFRSVGKKDAGAFLCIAANGIPPKRSKRFALTVLYPPKVSLNMEVLKVPRGERVSINCSVTGSPPPTIMWKRFDENIQTDGVKHRVYNSRSMTDVESRLEVLLLEESDHFVSYSCIGINSEGAAEDRVDIEVIEKQPAVYDSAPQETEVETRVQLWDTNEGGEVTQEGGGHGNKVRPTKSSKSSNFQINLYDTKRIDEKHQERIHYMHNQANAKFITSSNVVVISFLIVILNLVVRF